MATNLPSDNFTHTHGQPPSFEAISHQAHQDWYEKFYTDVLAKEAVMESWKASASNPTINNWLHARMWNLADVLATPGSNWLTVGDGYGFDAHYLLQKSCSVIASDISPSFLPLAQSNGFINEYSIQNAEQLTFPDNHFDYVLCKEAYHHFPRPYLAVYEMLRVARKAVILIEPHDPISKMPLLLLLRNILDSINPRLLQRFWKNRYSFEKVGNYVFKLSELEIEKLAMGMNLPAVAFKGINNNYYRPGIGNSSLNSKDFQRIRLKVNFHNLLSKAGFIPYQVLGAIIFKELPTESTTSLLSKNGFCYYSLPRNPYLNK